MVIIIQVLLIIAYRPLEHVLKARLGRKRKSKPFTGYGYPAGALKTLS
jgi:hypothetical protein